MDSRKALTILVAATLAAWSFQTSADADSGYPAIAEANALETCTTADVRAWRIIRVGEASLALDDCSEISHPFSAPFRLRFSYQRDIPGDAFRESSLAMLERNLDEKAYAELKARFEQFNQGYVDTGDGDTYQLSLGTEGDFILSFNERVIAREKGEDFANAYLQIWFGEKPFSGSLKDNLLDR